MESAKLMCTMRGVVDALTKRGLLISQGIYVIGRNFGGRNFGGQNFGGQNYRKTKLSADKIIGRQNYRRTKFLEDKIFGSLRDYRHFWPLKFCPVWFEFFRRISRLSYNYSTVNKAKVQNLR